MSRTNMPDIRLMCLVSVGDSSQQHLRRLAVSTLASTHANWVKGYLWFYLFAFLNFSIASIQTGTINGNDFLVFWGVSYECFVCTMSARYANTRFKTLSNGTEYTKECEIGVTSLKVTEACFLIRFVFQNSRCL